MHAAHGTPPRRRSAFAAAFLSLVFPGLGHAYAGALQRALGFAAAPLLGLSLLAGLASTLKLQLLGLAVQRWALVLILVLDLVLLLYRVIAAVDAWRVALHLNALEEGAAVYGAVPTGGGAGGRARATRPRLAPGLGSAVGLLAVLAVMTAGHVAVAQYGLQAWSLVDCVFDAEGAANCTDPGDGSAAGSGAPDGSGAGSADASGIPTPTPNVVTAPPDATAAPAASLPPWNGSDRLNILLVGTDRRPGESAFNTDTLIVVSIDPKTRSVAMLQVPRDTVDIPLPAGPARSVFGSAYRGKINSLWMQAVARPDLWPGGPAVRGANAIKGALGELYGLDIRWYVMVDFEGFRKVVDTLGGVTVDVQLPVMDDRYPLDSGRLGRIYIPSGVQHFTGTEALIYARSRHASTDFDRGSRQQRVLVSLKEQTDFGTIVGKVPALVDALKGAVKTDIPVGQLPGLLSLAASVDTAGIRSLVFTPPYYQTEILSGDPRGYVIEPNVARIRAAVKEAFTADPGATADKERIAAEGATVWVLNGSGSQGQAAAVAGFLDARGVNATAPNQAPATKPSKTTIVVYNGAESRLTETIKLLEAVLGVTATTATDPAIGADIVIVTSRRTPDLTPPPGP